MGAGYGGVEAGGTKFVCAVGSGPDDIWDEKQFPTTTPAETMARTIEFFRKHRTAIKAVGIACFGPIDLHHESATYGYITTTPKLEWINTNIAQAVAAALELPVGFDTDVNGAALGEWRWGAAQGLDTFIYLTVGTGIGGGGLAGGKLMHGLIHPEMGHIRIPHDWAADPFGGACPYHGDCFEGLASGTAMKARWGREGRDLAADHPAWALEARYLGLALANFVCTLSPQRIIIGGGVMHQQQLFSLLRAEVLKILADYVQTLELLEHMERYIVPPGLGDRAGVLGAMALAMEQG